MNRLKLQFLNDAIDRWKRRCKPRTLKKVILLEGEPIGENEKKIASDLIQLKLVGEMFKNILHSSAINWKNDV